MKTCLTCKTVATLNRIMTAILLTAILLTCNAFPIVAQTPPNPDVGDAEKAAAPTADDAQPYNEYYISYDIVTGVFENLDCNKHSIRNSKTNEYAPPYNPDISHLQNDAMYESNGTKTIIDKDGRDIVQDVTISPFKKIVFIKSFFPNGSVIRGTGVVLGPDLVLTAGHLIYQTQYGGWTSYCRIYAEVDGSNPISSNHDGQSTRIVTSSYWAVPGSSPAGSDWAYMIVNNDIGYEQGWMGFGYSPSYFNGYTVSGYPVTDPDGKTTFYMYSDTGDIEFNADSTMYISDTIDGSGGQSGSPLYTPTSIVYGVYVGGTSSYTQSTRITQSLFNYLLKNREEGIERWSS